MNTTGSRTSSALRPLALRVLLLAVLAAVLLGLQAALPGRDAGAGFAKVTVNNVGDDGDFNTGDGICETAAGNNNCTLRAAIEEANASFSFASDEINFDPVIFDSSGDVINLTVAGGCLPDITREYVIDATGAEVTLDGNSNCTGDGLHVFVDHADWDFSLIGGGSTFLIRDFEDDGVQILADTCDDSLGTIVIDGMEIDTGDGGSSDDGIRIQAPNIVDASITDNDIEATGSGINIEGNDSDTSDCDSDELTDNSVEVTGNTVAGDERGVGVRYDNGEFASTISVNVSDNPSITTDTRAGVIVAVGRDDAGGLACETGFLGGTVNVDVNDNGTVSTGGGGGDPKGVSVQVDFDDTDCENLDITVNVNGNDSVSGTGNSGSDGVKVDVDVDGGSSDTVSTVNVNDNTLIEGDEDGVEVDNDIGCGDHNTAITNVKRNDEITGDVENLGGGDGVEVDNNVSEDGDCGDDVDADFNRSEVHVDENGTITGGYDAEGVDIDSDADDDSDNTSIVTVDGNTGNITGGDDAILIESDAGDGDGTRNSSQVSVSGNEGQITATDTTGGGPDDAIDIHSHSRGDGVNYAETIVSSNDGPISADDGGDEGIEIYTDAEGAGLDGSNMTTARTIVGDDPNDSNDDGGNGEISGINDAVDINSDAGGDSDWALSEVHVDNNGQLAGDVGEGVDVDSRAGDPDENGDPADDNRSEVTVNDNNDGISGGDEGVQVLSVAGNDGCCPNNAANRNTSNVEVNGNGDIVGEGGDGVTIEGVAGARDDGPADGNVSTATVNDNDSIRGDPTGCCGSTDGVDIELLAGTNSGSDDGDDNCSIAIVGGGTPDAGDCSVNTASGTGNGDIETGSTGSQGNDGIDVESFAEGGTSGSLNNHAVIMVSDNEGDITGGQGIDAVPEVCCDSGNTNTVIISDNEGDITGEASGGEGIFVGGASGGALCCSENIVTIEDNGDDKEADVIGATGSGGDGIEIVGGDDYDDHTLATISGNTVRNDTSNIPAVDGESGILLRSEGNGDAADFSGSVISDNHAHFNGGSGIYLFEVSDVYIGPDNHIHHNGSSGSGGTGIVVEGDESDGNTIRGNVIFDNEGLGIDLLDPDGVGCTDPDGPNQCVGFPTFKVFNKLSGKITGNACKGCSVDIYRADNDPDDNDEHGEGVEFIGKAEASISTGEFSIVLPCGQDDLVLTSTATDGNGNTSEFGPNLDVDDTVDCTPTPTNTATRTPTNTATTGPTNTPTNTVVGPPPTSTRTFTPTRTPTSTPTSTSTATATVTSTATVTTTGTQSPSATPTKTSTVTATNTPTNTAVPPTATRTRTPTRTATPPTVTPAKALGDVNGDGDVNSIDAALILQFVAGRISSLPGEDNADVDLDGDITAIDAQLILQFEAGYIDTLPPSGGGGLDVDAARQLATALVNRLLPW